MKINNINIGILIGFLNLIIGYYFFGFNFRVNGVTDIISLVSYVLGVYFGIKAFFKFNLA